MKKSWCLTGLEKSGHIVLSFSYHCFIEAAFRHFSKLNFHKGDFKSLESTLRLSVCLAVCQDMRIIRFISKLFGFSHTDDV